MVSSQQPSLSTSSYADRAKQGRPNPNPIVVTVEMDNLNGDSRKQHPLQPHNGISLNGDSKTNVWAARKEQLVTAQSSNTPPITISSAPSSSSNPLNSSPQPQIHSSKSSKKKQKSRIPTPNKSSQPSPVPPAPPSFADESSWPEPAQAIAVTRDASAPEREMVPAPESIHSREGSTNGSKKKDKWVPIPAAELQAAVDASHLRGSHKNHENGARRHGGGSKKSSIAGSPAKGVNSLHSHANSTARSSYNSSPRAPSFNQFQSAPSRSPLILEAQFGHSRPQSQFGSPQRVTVPVFSPYPQHPIPNHHPHHLMTPSFLSIQQPLPAQPPNRRRLHRPSPSQSSPLGGDIPPTPQRNEYAFKPVFGSVTPSGDVTNSSSPAGASGLGLAVDGGVTGRKYDERSQTEAEKIMKRDGKFGIGIDDKVPTPSDGNEAVIALQINVNELKLDAGVEITGEASVVVPGDGTFPSDNGVRIQAPYATKKWSFGTLDETAPYSSLGVPGDNYPPSSSGGYSNSNPRHQQPYYNNNSGYYNDNGYYNNYNRGGGYGGRRYEQDDYRSSRRSSPGDGQQRYYSNGNSNGYHGNGPRRGGPGGRGGRGYGRGHGGRGMNGGGHRGGGYHHQEQHQHQHHLPPPQMQPPVISPYGPPPPQPYAYPPHPYGVMYDHSAAMSHIPQPVEYGDPYGVPAPQLPLQTTDGGSGAGGSPAMSQLPPPPVDPQAYPLPPTPQMIPNPYSPYGMYPPPVQQPPYMGQYMYGQPMAYAPPMPMLPVVGQQQQQINGVGVAPGGATYGAPIPMPITYPGYQLDPLRHYLLGQIEYYFSIQNLTNDVFLRKQMDSEGWIDIATIASFNRVKRLTTDLTIVKETMLLSQLVEVDEEATKVRLRNGAWDQFVIPEHLRHLEQFSSPNVGGGGESTTTATTTETGESSGRSPSSTVDGGNDVLDMGKQTYSNVEEGVPEVPVIS